MRGGSGGLGLTTRGEGLWERGLAGLPVAASTLVGREQERLDVAELLTRGRLVTLTGAGGCGKTRLALEVAGDVAAEFADGACWVDLAGVRDPGMMATSLADAVGVREEPHQALLDTLVEQLRGWDVLVVLDNCEHLVESCAAAVAALMRSCPRVRVLATSRAPLVVEGETAWEVPPLSVPDPDARSAQEVVLADSARLFELRARQVRAGFALRDDNAAVVGEICRRLDGMPLAVELAATRVRVLSPSQIAEGLADRFRLLTGGVRDTEARQQTLEASVAWSYDLLSDAERLTLARLSVFAGSFELEAAQTVVAGPGIEETQVLDLVTALADGSLLQVGERDGQVRYRLLETIRMYAGERLAKLDDPARVRDRHLDFYVALAGRERAGLVGSDGEGWSARLTAELSDLRAAMAWAVESDRPLTVVDIAEPTQWFWVDRGRYLEIERWLRAAINAPAATDADRVRGLVTATWVMFGSGHLASAHGFADQAVPVARMVDEPDVVALSLAMRALTGLSSGLASSEDAKADANESVSLAAGIEDNATRSSVLIIAGTTACYGHSLEDGRRLLEQALGVCEDAGISFYLSSAYAFLGTWLLFCGDLDRCRRHARRGVEWSRRIDRPGVESVALGGLAIADLLTGDIDAAREQIADAEALLRARGLSSSLFALIMGRWAALTAYRCVATGEARQVIDARRRSAREQGDRYFEAWAAWLLGLLALEDGRHDDARAQFEHCRTLSVDPRYPFTLGRALIGLADLDGDPAQAWELAHEGLEVLADFGDRIGTAEALETLAGVAMDLDRPGQALRLLAAAERFHHDTGIVRFPLAADRAARHVAAARAQLGPDDAEAIWSEGMRLSLNEAVAYARRGRGERARPQAGWASLTPTERETVRLVAEGHTNAEIGERMFVSVHTVKKHLSHVYAKLGLDGRSELVAQAARRDL